MAKRCQEMRRLLEQRGIWLLLVEEDTALVYPMRRNGVDGLVVHAFVRRDEEIETTLIGVPQTLNLTPNLRSSFQLGISLFSNHLQKEFAERNKHLVFMGSLIVMSEIVRVANVTNAFERELEMSKLSMRNTDSDNVAPLSEELQSFA